MNAVPLRADPVGIPERAGVPVAIIGNDASADELTFDVRNMKTEAANAVSYGMDHDAALRAVTLTPAELFGVSDHIGSLRPGA